MCTDLPSHPVVLLNICNPVFHDPKILLLGFRGFLRNFAITLCAPYSKFCWGTPSVLPWQPAWLAEVMLGGKGWQNYENRLGMGKFITMRQIFE